MPEIQMLQFPGMDLKGPVAELTVGQVQGYFESPDNTRQFCQINAMTGSLDALLAFLLLKNSSCKKNFIEVRWNTNGQDATWRQNVCTAFSLEKKSLSFDFPVLSSDITLQALYEKMRDEPGSMLSRVDGVPRLSDRADKQLRTYLGLQAGSVTPRKTRAASHTDPQGRLEDLIRNGQYQIILTGAPGTGKTFVANEVAQHFVREQMKGKSENEIADALDKRIKMVQFHPSYDYTDFVEGLRPISDKDNGMRFEKVDGTFKAFCRMVAEKNKKMDQNDQKSWPLYFFLIDEINRADLSKVFGELMYCMEKDKRGKDIPTQYHNLPTYGMEGKKNVFEDGFFIPPNVVIIGTMNDIDRSVESMDFALRRRFVWEEVVVDKNLLETVFQTEKFFENRPYIGPLTDRIMAFNNAMKTEVTYLNSGYDISQGQFSDMPESAKESLDKVLEWVWNYRVESLLKEYLRGDSQLTEYMEYLEAVWFGQTKQTSEDDPK